ncbi:hypothetical protein [Amorphus sp. 3PC139-8]|uniref:hypothetical protein n=1 Tax=Amorphus sp. 3PC139-8 TaxID=2735676 RepID=UPI00345D9731
MSSSGTKPRIHWVSPLPPAETDIAEYTRRILPALSERSELTLWTDRQDWSEGLDRKANVRAFASDSIETLTQSLGNCRPGQPEAVFLHIGNNWQFHAGIARLAQQIPAYVVLHDVALLDFFRDLSGQGKIRRLGLLQDVVRWYGADAAMEIAAVLTGGLTGPDLYGRYPLWEIGIGRAAGVVVHTKPAEAIVGERAPVPVYRLELPFRAGGNGSPNRRNDGPLRFVQFGHIGPNRRLDVIFEALGQASRKIPDFDFIFDVFGKLWDPALFKRLAADYGISDKIRFRGFVSETELDEAISDAHLVFNLRNPTMGEASGSQLRIWANAAYSVVTDIGWYATLPSDTVAKVPAADERTGLLQVLERLHKNRAVGQQSGAAGLRLVGEKHTPERYADDIVSLAEKSARDIANQLLRESAERVLARGGGSELFARRIEERLGSGFLVS